MRKPKNVCLWCYYFLCALTLSLTMSASYTEYSFVSPEVELRILAQFEQYEMMIEQECVRLHIPDELTKAITAIIVHTVEKALQENENALEQCTAPETITNDILSLRKKLAATFFIYQKYKQSGSDESFLVWARHFIDERRQLKRYEQLTDQTDATTD